MVSGVDAARRVLEPGPKESGLDMGFETLWQLRGRRLGGEVQGRPQGHGINTGWLTSLRH